MIGDILTVMWKERRQMLRLPGARARFAMVVLSPLCLALWGAIEEPARWPSGFFTLLISAITSMIVVCTTIPDSVAGERERHTLETLLASRLPDRAILLGKMAVPVLLGWAATVFVLLAALVAANVSHLARGGGGILLYGPGDAAANLGLGLLLAVLTAGAGTLISLRSPSVQQATQKLTAILLMPPMVLGPVLMVFHGPLAPVLRALDTRWTMPGILVLLALVDGALVSAAFGRFRRASLCFG